MTVQLAVRRALQPPTFACLARPSSRSLRMSSLQRKSTADPMPLLKISATGPGTESIAPASYRTAPPPHHKNGRFASPWPSHAHYGLLDFFKIRMTDWDEPPLPPKDALPPVREATFQTKGADKNSIRYTWLGHASCHVQVPTPSGKPFTVLTDPVFSRRCSPFSFTGPSRYTEVCTTVNAIAASPAEGAWPDVVVLSHNHYDHLDLNTIKALIARPHGKPVPHFFCTLGNKPWFLSLGLRPEQVTELDWWDRRVVEREGDGAKMRFTCTPAQHFSGRGLTDRGSTLWAGWAFESLSSEAGSDKRGAKVYFAGDTGLRSIPRKNMTREEEDELPFCPAFKELGAAMGPFDLSLIPIGAYEPRTFMSPVHCSPADAVHIHRDVQSRKTYGIHWGVFRLTPEAVDEPPQRLKEEAAAIGLEPDEFAVCEIGETVDVPVA